MASLYMGRSHSYHSTVLGTLFLLSYAKLFNTVLTVLSYTTQSLYTIKGEELDQVWSADGNIAYNCDEHTPLFMVAVAILLFYT